MVLMSNEYKNTTISLVINEGLLSDLKRMTQAKHVESVSALIRIYCVQGLLNDKPYLGDDEHETRL